MNRKIRSFSCGGNHTLILDTTGLYSFGNNKQKQCSDEQFDFIIEPRKIDKINWYQVSAGFSHSLGIDIAGNLYSWGWNAFGQCGVNVTDKVSKPCKIFGDKQWKIAVAGSAHSMAIDSNDKLYAWGNYNYDFEIPNDISNMIVPQLITDKRWKIVSGGYAHSLAIDIDDELYVWGLNYEYQCGIGIKSDRYFEPIKINDMKWKAIACGHYHSLAINMDGDLYVWGRNNHRQCGPKSTGKAKYSMSYKYCVPVKIEGRKWKAVEAGYAHSLALDVNGNLYVWGMNGLGQCGVGSIDNKKIEEPTLILTDIVDISSGDNHACALDVNNNLHLWGANASYQCYHAYPDFLMSPKKLEYFPQTVAIQ